ncbi:uncharacterized protein MONOS_17746 [Monocercomonoides exilis]|uniref:uncharacterized protein n=1 Tax=Monocercomonoides exilis TaxID=2049356 RepID=UPI00355ACD69|nr:hypothetical protein MONOS_17746 [Monocercomonoides exilis]
MLSASENTILVPPQRTTYVPSIGETLLELTNPSFQSTSSSITTPAIISFSTQPLGPSAALSNRLLLCLLATRTALTAVATAAHRLMVKKDLLHKISAIFETHHVQKPSSSPSMFISASLIQRLEVVGAAFAQATPSAFASVQQTSESQSTSLAPNITTDALDLSGSSNSAADEANTTSVGMR